MHEISVICNTTLSRVFTRDLIELSYPFRINTKKQSLALLVLVKTAHSYMLVL